MTMINLNQLLVFLDRLLASDKALTDHEYREFAEILRQLQYSGRTTPRKLLIRFHKHILRGQKLVNEMLALGNDIFSHCDKEEIEKLKDLIAPILDFSGNSDSLVPYQEGSSFAQWEETKGNYVVIPISETHHQIFLELPAEFDNDYDFFIADNYDGATEVGLEIFSPDDLNAVEINFAKQPHDIIEANMEANNNVLTLDLVHTPVNEMLAKISNRIEKERDQDALIKYALMHGNKDFSDNKC